MNRILLFFISLLLIYPVYSQTVFFHEDFELPSGADSVVSSGNPGWNINTSFAFMSNQSMHSYVALSDTSYLATNSFSTLGSSNVMLTFHHIAKINFFDGGILEVSTDSINWTHITVSNSVYIGSPGSSFGLATGSKFNSATYPAWVPWDDTLSPTNSWWRYEAFDLSFLLANQANVWIRFKIYDATANGGMGDYGWLIDNILVSDNPNAYHYLQGTVFHDLNSNGVLDGGEPPVKYKSVFLQPQNISLFTNSQGQFYTNVFPGNYQITYTPPPNWSLTSSPATYSVSVTNMGFNNLNFGISPDSLFYDITGNLISSSAKCYGKIQYNLNYLNSGTLTSDSIRIIFDADPNLTFNYSYPAPDLIAGNTYIWTQPGLAPLTLSQTVYLLMNVPLAAGTIVTSVMTVMHLDSAGNILATDIDTLTKVVTCAWDPNDKSVDPPGVQAQNFTLMGEELEYMIRFQNTGNDTAFKVVIVDTLSMHLDWESFKLISMSHDLSSAVINNGIITFTFDDIMLPDSIVDEPNSHGFIVFSINHKINLTDQTVIENTAYIYFDFNAAVVTNTTLNTMVNQIPVSIPGVKNAEIIKLYPNPVNKYFNLAGVKENAQYYIADLSGRIIISGKITGEDDLINVEGIKAGAYILRLHSKEIIYSIKFFKIE